ncbi:MAG: CRISPR-associated endonuclease Cas6, partial [Catalinimonas sp.]
VEFDVTLAPWEVPAFRGAVVARAGRAHDLFHNHAADGRGLYRYPLIQYKRAGERPVLLCLQAGVDSAHHFFGQPDWSLTLPGRTVPVRIHRLDLRQFNLNVWDRRFRYRLHRWVALNQENAARYEQLTGLAERVAFLERTLIGNVLSFAKGVGWRVPRQIEVRIETLRDPRPTRVKQHQVLAFGVDFTTNVFLPDFVGLGKHASIGFGVVRALKKMEG